MKKTFKKTLILMTVITVMMICALVFSASAEDKTICPNNEHVLEIKETPATCTEDGYSVYYCKICETVLSGHIEGSEVNRTGHNFVVTGYEANEDGSAFSRVVKCTNDVCVRGSEEPTVLKSGYIYHSVEFVNEYESPKLGEVNDHQDYFLDNYYVASNSNTWVVDLNDDGTLYLSEKYAPAKSGNAVAENGEDINSVKNPEYEYFENADGEIELYVLNGCKAQYNGEKPTRCKDTEIGRYTFNAWVVGDETVDNHVITENTTFEAKFDADENIVVSYTFMNGSTELSTAIDGIPYGGKANYGGATPVRYGTVEYSYNFIGWSIDNEISFDELPVTLYHNAKIYARFETIKNKYNLDFVDYKGDAFVDSEGETITGIGTCYTAVSKTAAIDSGMLKRPSDHMYNYAPVADKWQVVAVNGKKVVSPYKFDINCFNLPVQFELVETAEKITYDKYESISVAPVYYTQPIVYDITVSIKHVYFEPEDLIDYDTPRGDILDDFVIQVYDAKGEYVTAKRTDSKGKAEFQLHYSDAYTFTATTADNSKYYGENKIVMSRVYETIEFTGVGIAPSVTEEWKNSQTYYCNCLCHGILSPIAIRIYNLLYRLFGIKYVCCDDLFVAHGDILVYMK